MNGSQWEIPTSIFKQESINFRIYSCSQFFVFFFVRNFTPGSMLAWNTYYNNMKKHTDAVGLECILVLENEVIPIDIALINGDMVGVAKILRKVLPYVRKLALHLKDEGLRKSIEYAGDEAEKTIAQLEADGANISMFSSLVEATTVNLRDILKALIYSVVDLVGNVIHAIHH